ncbi:hypothetical protein [Candidatus Pelagibacter sp.]|jgi:hypothetical protein|uniref:hypothetical protein n=1 Tax=Candidatus Pelagibacter sp. TaxID=2024849 RepID=UPI003D0F4C49|tara:strand:+ start:4027 stop:4227 length:201 start_codon:yes stop_codon:yes gene_type:complete
MSFKKYLRPKDVEDIYSIKISTLAKQRQGKYGLPYSIVGRKKHKQKGGVILYSIDDINDFLNKHKK